MCNKEHLVGYVYRELTAQEMAVFESHIRECADCRTEVEQLVGTRQHLASWSPPQPDLDFTVVRTAPAAAAPRRPVLGFVPQWTLSAAAAALLLAGAAAVANLELRYDAGGFVLRTGWSAPAQAANGAPVPSGVPAARQAVAAVESSEQVRAQLVALSERLRQLEQAEANHLTKASGPSVQEGISVAQLRRILDELEARQRTEMALQIGQVWRDFNAARANDAAYFQKTLGQAQGLTNYQLRQHRDSIESLYRVSQLK
jgi:hypothetical protein